MTGDLPIRDDVARCPATRSSSRRYPGIGEWVTNLENSKQTRPVSTVYPKISTAVGQAVQGVLLGKYQPKQALDQAAQQVDGSAERAPADGGRRTRGRRRRPAAAGRRGCGACCAPSTSPAGRSSRPRSC